MAERKSTAVFVPTYNERDNVKPLAEQILGLGVDLDLVFMDDNSTDGTGAVLDELANRYPNVKILRRSGKLGVGSAHYDGIQWGYDQGYTHFITMDCDFTHPPAMIPEILKLDADIAVGSRYMQKKSLQGWNFFRKFLTMTGHFLTHTLLGMPYDATGGFRYYRLDRVPRYAFYPIRSKGYSFFFESLYILHFNKFTIKEIPISLPPRTYGHSKMTTAEIKRSVKLLVSIYLTKLFDSERFRMMEPVTDVNASAVDKQGWDDYWKDQKGTGGVLYDVIAAFYRKFIIKRTLNHFIRKYFPKGANVLHAGCGSGQVDTDISQHISITGLDISVNALNFYKKTNGPACKTLHGSIFQIPLADRSIDGIYNLGVMEHFEEKEIRAILTEFRRVLKDDGRMVIFWPPEFGASVIFLKMVKWFLENVMGKKNVKLHPDEITRVQSRKHVTTLFEESGFKVLKYYFGLMDFFTYSIIVVDKSAAVVAPESVGELVTQ